MVESMTPQPEDPYGIAKYAVELDLAAAHRLFGLPYIIFRPHNVYGERQNTGDRYRNVIGIFMNQILKGEPCTIFGDGEQSRAFSYISDVAQPIARSITVPGAYQQTFNIGADIPYRLNDLLASVQRAMGKSTGVVRLPAREEVVHAHSDHSKARDVLGCRPRIDLEEGLARMAAWVKENGPRMSPPFSGIEVERHLPSVWREHLS
jgi:UDP-glucose 4-epimerase